MRPLLTVILTIVTCLLLAPTGEAGAPPEGIYLRSVFDGSNLNNTILVFKNGKVAFNPTGDLEKIDFARLAAANPNSVATYQVDGKNLTILWSTGHKQTGEMRPDRNGGFDFGSAPHAAVKPLTSGNQLSGTYTGGASIAGASASVTYTFDGQGGYKTNAAGVAVTSTSASQVTAGNSSADSGTYKISGSRIILNGSAGTREISLYQIPTRTAKASPDMLLLGGVVMTKS